MAGQIKANQIQLGDSVTATQNFVLQTNVDGTAKLARGNVGSTTQDILTVDAAGKLGMIVPPVNAAAPAFSAYLSAAQSISSGVRTKLQLNTKEFDVTSAYDNTTNYRFQPTVAGYYQCTVVMEAGGTTASLSAIVAAIYKNGSEVCRNAISATLGNSDVIVTRVIFLNGSTDYLEAWGQLNATTPQLQAGSNTTYFQAALISRSA